MLREHRHIVCSRRCGARITLSMFEPSVVTISEFESKRCEKLSTLFVEKHRAPPHLRHELDFSFRISGQSIVFFEVRPSWQEKTRKLEHLVAKATYNKTKKVWRVFWRRADGKWHVYPPAPEVTTFEKFLELVGKDEHACFFG